MAQDWGVHALVYFYSAGSDLPWAVLYWRLDLELTDMTKDEALKLVALMLGTALGVMLAAIGAYTLGVYAGVVR
jgi:hypothetical protein